MYKCDLSIKNLTTLLKQLKDRISNLSQKKIIEVPALSKEIETVKVLKTHQEAQLLLSTWGPHKVSDPSRKPSKTPRYAQGVSKCQSLDTFTSDCLSAFCVWRDFLSHIHNYVDVYLETVWKTWISKRQTYYTLSNANFRKKYKCTIKWIKTRAERIPWRCSHVNNQTNG